MADDDGDVIYVDVKARLDEASADEAEQKLRDKFKDATKDLGENIKDAFDNLGDHLKEGGGILKDAFSKENISGALQDARETIGDALNSDLGKEITGSLRENLEHELGATFN